MQNQKTKQNKKTPHGILHYFKQLNCLRQHKKKKKKKCGCVGWGKGDVNGYGYFQTDHTTVHFGFSNANALWVSKEKTIISDGQSCLWTDSLSSDSESV